MRVVSLDNTTPADGVSFTLADVDTNKNGDVRMAIKKASVFDSKTIAIEVQHPSNSDWYTTGVSIATEADCAVIALRPNYTYRAIPSATGGALNVSLMFF